MRGTADLAPPHKSMKKLSIGPLAVGGGAPLAVIAGPCVIESEDHALQMAEAVAAAARQAGIGAIFKASFDKANRTSKDSYRGPGLDEGLRILGEAKRRTGLPVLTDIHEVSQVGPAAEVCDVLQIPAFLCRQTDLLVEAGRSGRVVNIKKGQFLAPWDIRHAAEKVAAAGGGDRILLTERGSSFGYNNLVVDFRSLAILRETGYPVVLDVTHSLQLPGGSGHVSGGQPQFIEPLARAGAAFGVDALFFEVHDHPERALSDGANALRLDLLGPLLDRLAELDRLVRPWLPASG
jgi:2-dehydro-3-deoxyphosphooctonate aldolase (KDO 8-P synthase)